MPLANRVLSRFLQSKIPPQATLLDKLKIGYRPYICPFNDLLDCIPPGASVFDIGCGNGMFLSLVANFRQPTKLGGIEISNGLIKNAQALLQETHIPLFLQTFNGRDLPTEIERYTHIYMIDVLHHIPPAEQARFLQSVYEKMQPKARLILKDINGQSVLSFFNKLHDLIFSGEIGHELPAPLVQRLLSNCGFHTSPTLKKTVFFYPHFTIIAEK